VSLPVIEQAVIVALSGLRFFNCNRFLFSVHLVGRVESWNQKILAVPEGKALRNHNPFEIVELGMVVLRQIVLNLNEDVKVG
jgi:hypothetical protein